MDALSYNYYYLSILLLKTFTTIGHKIRDACVWFIKVISSWRSTASSFNRFVRFKVSHYLKDIFCCGKEKRCACLLSSLSAGIQNLAMWSLYSHWRKILFNVSFLTAERNIFPRGNHKICLGALKPSGRHCRSSLLPKNVRIQRSQSFSHFY